MVFLWFVLYFVALVCSCALVGATRAKRPQRVRVEVSRPSVRIYPIPVEHVSRSRRAG